MTSWSFLVAALLVFLCASHFDLVSCLEDSTPPNVLFILADDFGWYDVGYHNPKIQTPNINKLAKDGVKLDSYYVQPLCTPTRGALMTGRYPIHTGYATHLLGKWHLGFYKWPYVPTNRGFDTAYGFLGGGSEDHFDHTHNGVVDFRDNLEPVKDLNGTYATNAYVNRVEKILQAHDPSQPMFMYMAFQNVHAPIQAPEKYIEKYDFIKDKMRRVHAAMADIMDEAVGNITDAFKKAGLWNNTVLIFSTDNGGIPKFGGYNWPLRGEKMTLWEGGVRGVGFVHGNLLARKGVTCKELLHVTDWYPTILRLAGVTSEDKSPIPLDGHDVWDTISLGKPSPRTEMLLNIDLPGSVPPGPDVLGGYSGIALRMGEMKLLMNVPNVTWFKPPEIGGKPEREIPLDAMLEHPDVDKVEKIDVALYNISTDPEERVDLSKTLPDIVKKMQMRLKDYMKSSVKPLNQKSDPVAFKTAQKNGIWGPWRD
ncbi:arylsulfatase B-like isoform X2 [Oculina patagonica]